MLPPLLQRVHELCNNVLRLIKFIIRPLQNSVRLNLLPLTNFSTGKIVSQKKKSCVGLSYRGTASRCMKSKAFLHAKFEMGFLILAIREGRY